MESDPTFNPYHRPTPYDLLGLRDGPATPTREIGRVYNEETKKAKLIADIGERSRRLDELKDARDRLLRPEDRVLIDFFLLGSNLFATLCERHAARLLDAGGTGVAELLGDLYPVWRHDDPLPNSLSSVTEEFAPIEPEFFEEPAEPARLPLTTFEF